MKLSDIDIKELIAALRKERSKWIDVASEEGRKLTDAERATVCILSALENVIGAASAHGLMLELLEVSQDERSEQRS